MKPDRERGYFEGKVATVLRSPEYQAAAEANAGEQQRELRARRSRRLRSEAAAAVAALKDPRISARVEQLIHDVGAGVLALAVWNKAYGEGRELTLDERRAMQIALMSTQLETALGKVGELLDAQGRSTHKVGGR